MTRNRIFTDGLLSYIKRPGGAVRAWISLGTGGSSGTIGPGHPLRTGRTGGTGQAGKALGPLNPLGTGGSSGTGGPLRSRGAGGAPDRRTGRRTRRRARGGAAAVRGARGGQIGHHFPTWPAAPVGWKVMIHSRIRSFSLDRSMWLCHIPAYAFQEKMVPLPLPPDSGCATIF